jgi:hypothetical protein
MLCPSAISFFGLEAEVAPVLIVALSDAIRHSGAR